MKVMTPIIVQSYSHKHEKKPPWLMEVLKMPATADDLLSPFSH